MKDVFLIIVTVLMKASQNNLNYSGTNPGTKNKNQLYQIDNQIVINFQ